MYGRTVDKKYSDRKNFGRTFPYQKTNDTVMSTVQKKAPSVVDIATNDKNFSTLVSALQAAGLVDTLKGGGPFTVFAPTNAAFEDLSESVLEDLMKPTNKTRLQNLLKNHVIEGRRRARDVAESSSLTPMSGKRLHIRTNEDQQVRIGDATVRQTNLDAENGIVHVIDRILR